MLLLLSHLSSPTHGILNGIFNIKHQDRGKIYFHDSLAFMYPRNYQMNSQYKMPTVCHVRHWLSEIWWASGTSVWTRCTHHLLALCVGYGIQRGTRVELRRTWRSWQRLLWSRRLESLQLWKSCCIAAGAGGKGTASGTETGSSCAPLISDAESGKAAGDNGFEKMNTVASCPTSSLWGAKVSSSLAFRIGTWTEELWCLPLSLMGFH